MKRGSLFVLIGLLAIVFGVSQSIFFVPEDKYGVVTQLGKLLDRTYEPGAHFKIPFIQQRELVDKRVLSFVIPKTNTLTADMKIFEMDNYVCWKISDPIIFKRKLRAEIVAEQRLRSIVYAQLRATIGNKTLGEVVYASSEGAGREGTPPAHSERARATIMDEVLQKANIEIKDYGVTFIDVRIKRADLPNRDAIFARMNSERKRMANRYRSEGASEDRRIRSEAELARDGLLATAQKESTIIRGKADANVIEIFAKSLATNPDFYEFSKSLEVYRKSFKGNSKIILSTEDPLLNYFE